MIVKFDTPEERAIKALSRRGITDARATDIVNSLSGMERDIIADVFRPEARVRFGSFDNFTDDRLVDLHSFVKSAIEERTKRGEYDDAVFSSHKMDKEFLAFVERQIALPSINDHEWELVVETNGGSPVVTINSTTDCDDTQCYCHSPILEWAELSMNIPIKMEVKGGGYNSWHGDYDDCWIEAEVVHGT